MKDNLLSLVLLLFFEVSGLLTDTILTSVNGYDEIERRVCASVTKRPSTAASVGKGGTYEKVS